MSTRANAIAGVVLVLLFAAAVPVERKLRAHAPRTPKANQIGVGRLMGGVLAGPFRPMLQTYLWLRDDILLGQNRIEESLVVMRTMVALYPNNDAAKEFLGWRIAFNLKQEASTPELAWKFSREGLDILVDIPTTTAYRQVADWFLKQCGQSPLPPTRLRYAGKEWEQEKALRKKARAWTKRHWERPYERFDAGLKALGTSTKFFDQLRRLPLLVRGAADDCLRTGKSDKWKPAADLSRWMAAQLTVEGWKEDLEEQAWVLEQLAEGRLSPRLVGLARDYVAAALWGLGAHQKRLDLLQAALTCTQEYARQYEADCAAEVAAITAWIEYVRDPQKQRPPLPFD